VNPTLASTVNGPLWVTGGEDFWGVNPSTGKVQTEFNSGNVISGLSTDPSGTYLYGGGETPHGLAVVVEYNAVTGTKLFDVPVQDAIEGASVSATNGGVWISYRGGMAGTAAELSQSGLRAIASPTAVKGTEPFGAGPAMGGISSSVNDGVLWFGSQAGLACADPRTGVVRAYEHEAGNPGPGSSFVLYGSGTGGIVAITPPAACFG
jgi:hypothetical protein